MAKKLSARIGNTIYSLHPSYKMWETSKRNLVERTGKTLEEWKTIVAKDGPATEKERRDWLMKVHGFTTNYAWWLAEATDGRGGPDQYDPVSLVEAQYSGKKSALRPLYDALVNAALNLGDDICICPCETIVPIFRNHVIAQIKPATQKRIDFGLALGDLKASGRLIDTGGFQKKDRITHRIPIESSKDIDAEILRWLKKAYDRDK